MSGERNVGVGEWGDKKENNNNKILKSNNNNMCKF